MSLPLSRTALVVIILALGFALPACKKSKSTEQDQSDPNAVPGGPGPGQTGQRDSGAPRSPVFAGVAEAPMRPTSRSRLQQIGLALHSYHDSNNALPTGLVDKTGKIGLSWRVAILPHVEQDILYKQFKLDEPWDSPHNKALIDKMPQVYAPGNQNTNGYTFLRGFSGPNTWLPPQSGPRPQGIKLTSIVDGASNTILVAEAYDPVIWTKPDELEFAPNKVPAIGGVFSSGVNVLLADGSVRFLRKGFDPKMLAKLIQINDGQLVQFDD
jgi:prepilin-type processing-associated H-X9-DG protein